MAQLWDEQLASLPELERSTRLRLEADFERFKTGLPPDVRAYCLEEYGIDLQGEYAGRSVRVPIGKASGQLSLNVRQVQRDVEAGLGFVVLKTAIAEDGQGERSMGAWAVPETRMRVEPITGADGTHGWTVTWKGRGWHASLADYCRFFGEALDVAGASGVVIAPSVKYHLPGAGESEFQTEEYRFTTGALLDVWRKNGIGSMPLEKDFSPTLAGDNRSREREQILLWLQRVPELIRATASSPVCLGVKLMNARFDVDFQLEMLRTLCSEDARSPDYLIYANRLFDPAREFEGTQGIAYGGPDLGRRNLEVLRRFGETNTRGAPSISATGDILTGTRAVEYALQGATSCQLHTALQLPDRCYAGTMRNRSEAVLHQLIFHPEQGILAWIHRIGGFAGHRLHWLDLRHVRRGGEL